MMYKDEYGFGAMLAASLDLFGRMQRGEGRTTAMLDRMKPGDMLVVATAKEAMDIRRVLHDRMRPSERPKGMPEGSVMFAAATHEGINRIITEAARLKSDGALILSHDWIEAFYWSQLSEAQSLLSSLVTRFGRGAGEQPFDRPVTVAAMRLHDMRDRDGIGLRR